MSTLDRPLTPADLKDCMRLVAEAGWNQTENDWRTIFEIGEARGRFEAGELIASAAIVTYGRVGWVCMVLVTPSQQRRGHASQLLAWAGARLAELGLTPGLDATPAGRQVYARIGYQDVYGITRMERAAAPALDLHALPDGVRALASSDLSAIFACDRSAFGLDRSALLASLLMRRPELALGVFDGEVCRGFVLGREGRRATQIGPLVAESEAMAVGLLDGALAKAQGPAFIDVPDRHRLVRARLTALGFGPQRQFTRMLYKSSEPFDAPARIFALTGPEFA